MTQILMAAQQEMCGHFLTGDIWAETCRGLRGSNAMDENKIDLADRLGRVVSAVLLAVLFAMFTYGYLSHLLC